MKMKYAVNHKETRVVLRLVGLYTDLWLLSHCQVVAVGRGGCQMPPGALCRQQIKLPVEYFVRQGYLNAILSCILNRMSKLY